jgi:hypothetical protein
LYLQDTSSEFALKDMPILSTKGTSLIGYRPG